MLMEVEDEGHKGEMEKLNLQYRDSANGISH
jgi:hypothetical protein